MLSLAVENGSGALAMQRVCGATDAQLAALVSQLHALAGSSETLVGRVDGWIAHKASVDGPAAAAAAQRDALAAQLEVANAANARLDAELARARQAAALHAAVANRVSAEAQAREASGRATTSSSAVSVTSSTKRCSRPTRCGHTSPSTTRARRS